MAEQPTIIRVRNPEVLGLPGIGDFIERSFQHHLAPNYYQDHFDHFARMIADPSVGLIVGREGDEYLGLVLVLTFDSPMAEDAHLDYFHNEGSRSLRSALLQATRDFIHERGFSTMTTVNRTGHRKAYERLFGGEIGDLNVVGTLYRVDLWEGDSQTDDIVG